MSKEFNLASTEYEELQLGKDNDGKPLQFGNAQDTLGRLYKDGAEIRYYIEERPIDTTFSESKCYPDEISKVQQEAVERLFPFTKNSSNKTLTCPNWAKALMYKIHILQEVEKMVKHFNMGGEAVREKEHPHDQKISYLLIEDVFLQPMTKYEFDQVKGDQKIDFVIHPLKKDGETKTFTLMVSKDMSLGQLKSMLLYKTAHEPFCLKFFMKNHQKVLELKQKIVDDYKRRAAGDIYLEEKNKQPQDG